MISWTKTTIFFFKDYYIRKQRKTYVDGLLWLLEAIQDILQLQRKRQILQNLNIVTFSMYLVLGHSNTGVHQFQKEKKVIFYVCIPEIVTGYHTGSAFIPHYYVCLV